LTDKFLGERIRELNQDFRASIRNEEFEGKTVVCEFSDPNPFKVLHVGHLYTSVVGDAIARLYEYAGAKVVRANFGGDVGLHVAKTMYVLRQKALADLKIEDIAKCYVEGTVAYEEDEKAHAEITELNKEIYRINAEEVHGTELADLYWKARELSYEYFKEFYARIGVKFDKYYPESTVAGLGLKTGLEQADKGV
jgi:arginyl-tRNA synthetase